MVDIQEIPEGTNRRATQPVGTADGSTSSVSTSADSQSELRPFYDVVNFFQSLIDALVDGWSSLDNSMKQAIVVGIIALYIFSYYWVNILLLGILYQYVSSQKPTEDTFLPFFEKWFTTVYYPKVLNRLDMQIQRKRAEKERSGKFLQSLGEAVKGHLLNSTKEIQTKLIYQQILAQSSPIVVADKGLFLQVQMNIGSQENPSIATFWGLHKDWYLAPYLSIDFDKLDLAVEES
mmetsp:Transcript_18292/g.20684  ORF Transcript_18292/g.20684 Transcript_18292/m.20684 type:complete len:234 (-) Transcript_18292:1252-1953(-)